MRCMTSKSTHPNSHALMAYSISRDAEILICCFYLSFKISSVLGLSWILMFIASAADIEVLWWIATITSSLQGVHVFLSFGFNDKTRQMWKEKINETDTNHMSYIASTDE